VGGINLFGFYGKQHRWCKCNNYTRYVNSSSNNNLYCNKQVKITYKLTF